MGKLDEAGKNQRNAGNPPSSSSATSGLNRASVVTRQQDRKAWRLRNQEARVTAETEGRDIEDSGFEPNLIQRTLPTKRGLFLSARGVALLLSLLLSGCFSPFLEGVAIGTAPGPKGACVLFLAIAFREAFANLILGYQLAITRGDIVYTHVHMVFSAVILSIGINVGMILHEEELRFTLNRAGRNAELVMLFAAAILQEAIFHGLAAVVRSIGDHKLLVVLCPAMSMAGLLVFTLLEEEVDAYFRS
ncbi:unnamed protein product [Notodromas monacha]|uniref:Uncharacterized protein n=1 Tax=Notodromas monacha TaxID=399045 RepID=A0A7R9BPZ2_9CRUS|nr:unnamed protein product [Notodromas monacha]CAG0919500.1 unnamed protein product [Notodromas monacha]